MLKNWYSLRTSKPITSKIRYFEKRYFKTLKFEISETSKTYSSNTRYVGIP